jgi:tetratricopeptide (TPR) repeat protein
MGGEIVVFKRLWFWGLILLVVLSFSAVWAVEEVQPPYSFDVTAEGYAQVMFDQGYNLYQEGRKEEAIQFFIEAVSTKPNFIKAWKWLARTYQEEGMYDEAIWAWGKVLELAPDDKQAAYFKEKCENYKKYGKAAWDSFEEGIVAYQNGDYFSAIPLFEEAIRNNPEFDKAYYFLGAALIKVEDYHRAVWAFEKYLAFHPDDEKAQYFLKVAQKGAANLQ